MTLAVPVTHPEHPDQDLLKRGYSLEADVIERLRAMGVQHIYVDYPGLDDLDRHMEVNLSPARQTLYSQIKRAVRVGHNTTRPAVAYDDYYSTTRDLITTLLMQGKHPVYLEHLSTMGDDAVSHATAVSHLALLLGIKLETYLISQRKRLPAHHAKEVVNIGVAGMLHDLGKTKLPADLQKYNGLHLPQDPAQLELWQTHAQEGYDMVRQGIEPSAAATVLHHHQHFDGSGFPSIVAGDGRKSTPSGERIHIFARILAAANLYDRVASPPGSRSRRANIEVLHRIRTEYAGWCDPTVYKMLELVAPPFPPALLVKLSDGGSAIVIDVGQPNPYQPIIKRVVGADLTLDDKRVDLSVPGAPRITHVGQTNIESFMPN
jgi:HD-GYP domain-containing protein (c-di-GMP phosphodiesterase class II)